VQRMVRDVFRMKAEILCEHFAPETIQLMTGLPMQPELYALMQDDHLRSYRVDIETDSTIAADQGREKEQVVELLTGIGAFVEGIGPAVASGHFSPEAAKSMMKAAIRRYKFGSEVEDALEEQEQPQEGQDPAAMQQQAEMQQAQEAEQQAMMQQMVEQGVQQATETQTLQLKAQELQLKQAEMQAKAQIEQAKVQADSEIQQAKLQLEAEIKTAELNLKAQELALRERELSIKEAQTVREFSTQDEERSEKQSEKASQQAEKAEETDRENTTAVMLQQMAEAINALTEYVTAPKRVVYEKGRVSGIAVGDHVRPVIRSQSGEIEGLQ